MTPEQIQLKWNSFIEYPTADKTFVTTTSALLFARHIADEIRKDQEAGNESLTESLAQCRDLMPAEELDCTRVNLLNCAVSRTDCVPDYVGYVVAALKAENERLRAAIQELTESRDKWANRAAECKDDAIRYIWALPILTGEDNELADSRTLALGKAMLSGKTGRELVDHAMKETP